MPVNTDNRHTKIELAAIKYEFEGGEPEIEQIQELDEVKKRN